MADMETLNMLIRKTLLNIDDDDDNDDGDHDDDVDTGYNDYCYVDDGRFVGLVPGHHYAMCGNEVCLAQCGRNIILSLGSDMLGIIYPFLFINNSNNVTHVHLFGLQMNVKIVEEKDAIHLLGMSTLTTAMAMIVNLKTEECTQTSKHILLLSPIPIYPSYLSTIPNH